jgi:hypothetical protein
MLQPSDKECDQMHKWELERYLLLHPKIKIYRWIKTQKVDEQWGHIIDKNYEPIIFVLHADYDFDKKMKEFIDGQWIQTNNIEVKLCRRECELHDPAYSPNEGDLVEMMGMKLEVLGTDEKDLIKGTQFNYLHWACKVNSIQRTED